jgi:hypothetical protein
MPGGSHFLRIGAVEGVCYIVVVSWATSSVGRAPRSQCGGRGFESPVVHQIPQNPLVGAASINQSKLKGYYRED